MRVTDWKYNFIFPCGSCKPGSLPMLIDKGSIVSGDVANIVTNDGDVICSVRYDLNYDGTRLLFIKDQVLPDGVCLPRIDGISYFLDNVSGSGLEIA